MYVLVLLGGEAKNHALPRGGGGGVMFSIIHLQRGSPTKIRGVLPRSRSHSPGGTVVQLSQSHSNWAVFGTRKLDKNQGVTGRGRALIRISFETLGN